MNLDGQAAGVPPMHWPSDHLSSCLLDLVPFVDVPCSGEPRPEHSTPGEASPVPSGRGLLTPLGRLATLWYSQRTGCSSVHTELYRGK